MKVRPQIVELELEATRAIIAVIAMNLKGNLDNLTREQAIHKLQTIKIFVEEDAEDAT